MSVAYTQGFSSQVKVEKPSMGLSPQVVDYISEKNQEPQWLNDLRHQAYTYWKAQTAPPQWATFSTPNLDYQDMWYHAAPKQKPASLEEVDPEILRAYEKLGIPLTEQKKLAGVAVDAVFDSVSVGTTFQKELEEKGVIFCSFSQAVHTHPDLIKKYLGRVVPYRDNFFSALNQAVFSDGSFVYIPPGVTCPMPLSTYFRMNEAKTGQFERTLVIADKGSKVQYLEGCTAPMRDEHQLHAAVVELIAHEDAHIEYATVQNWYPGNDKGEGGVYNFVTKRGLCQGDRSHISWTQMETGSAITWKYPSCILKGAHAVGEFYSVAMTHNHQQADTGTKMIHVGPHTRSKIISKGVSAGVSSNTYRGLVRMGAQAQHSRNYSQCDSLILGEEASASTLPYLDIHPQTGVCEHEATTSKISDDQLFYARQRGLDEEAAIAIIVGGFCRSVLEHLPLEFAVEAKALLSLSLEGAVA